MVEVKEAEEKLIEELNAFKEEVQKSLEDIKYGFEFALKTLNLDVENNKSLQLLENLYETIGNFTIDYYPIENGTETLYINCKIDSEQYAYGEAVTENPLTEKILIYLLMSWQNEVKKCFTLVEGECANNHDYFCWSKNNELHKIIENYIKFSK